MFHYSYHYVDTVLNQLLLNDKISVCEDLIYSGLNHIIITNVSLSTFMIIIHITP